MRELPCADWLLLGTSFNYPYVNNIKGVTPPTFVTLVLAQLQSASYLRIIYSLNYYFLANHLILSPTHNPSNFILTDVRIKYLLRDNGWELPWSGAVLRRIMALNWDSKMADEIWEFTMAFGNL